MYVNVFWLFSTEKKHVIKKQSSQNLKIDQYMKHKDFALIL